MKKKLFKRIGTAALVLGVFLCIQHLYQYFFINYFTGLGARDWLSLFCLSIILIFSGILLLNYNDNGLLLLKGYIFGTIIDRLIAVILFREHLDYSFVFIHSITAIGFGVVFYYPNNLEYLKVECNLSKMIFLIMLIGMIILFPKCLL